MVQYTRYAKGGNERFLKEPLSVGWPWRMFVLVLTVFLVSVLSYVGLSFGYKPYLESTIGDIELELNSLSSQIESKNQKNFVDFYSQVANLKNLLTSHVEASKLLPLLESRTHSQVSYSTISLSIPEKALTIDAFAASYEVLAIQLSLYEQSTWVQGVVLNSSSLSDKTVGFSVKLTIKDEALKF